MNGDSYIFDLTLWLYILICAVSLYGGLLFLWWWIKIKHATAPFIYVTILLFGTFIRTAGDIIKLLYFYCDGDEYLRIEGYAWWDMRLIPILIGISLIVGHMTYRAFLQRKIK